MQIRKSTTFLFTIMLFISSCANIDEMNGRLDDIEIRIAKLDSVVSRINSDIVAINHALKDSVFLSVTENDLGYIIETTDGDKIQITDGSKCPSSVIPVIGVNQDGAWTISIAGNEPSIIEGATNAYHDLATPKVRISNDGYWQVSNDGGKTWQYITANDKKFSAIDGKEYLEKQSFFEDIIFENGSDRITFKFVGWEDNVVIPIVSDFILEIDGYTENTSILLGEAISYSIKTVGADDIAVQVPEGWNAKISEGTIIITAASDGQEGDYKIRVTAVSEAGYIKFAELVFHLIPQAFADILDFSYAGYKHGETAPANIYQSGYEIYDITSDEFGGKAEVGNNDRAAFIAVLEKIFGSPTIDEANKQLSFPAVASAKAIIYFPEGEYILHSEDDDESEYGSLGIVIHAGDLVIKGDGAEKSIIKMTAPMQLKKQDELFSSPDLIQIKHNTGHSDMASIVGTVQKGAFSAKVNSTNGISVGSWVCLYTKNNTSEFIAKELAPYEPSSSWVGIKDTGIEVISYHQVKEINYDNDIVTFHEPIMCEIAEDGWKLMTYPHYENVGIEDICFQGNAKDNFLHHGTGEDWDYDGGYKPISLMRVTNSWIRRVKFDSVSEACSIINSANVSAYDIKMTGKRGHSSIRAQASSRVLIAATVDNTESSDGMKGNYHGVGVSKQSIGTVLWRNRIGDDSSFESHASQPRATLIDCCEGGWHKRHQGGDEKEFPHHLADLTIWNYKVTKTSETESFTWWDHSSKWYFLPPIVVGFQGGINFDESQTKKISSHGMEPHPQSLYESQLKKRCSTLPQWLNNLKNQ